MKSKRPKKPYVIYNRDVENARINAYRQWVYEQAAADVGVCRNCSAVMRLIELANHEISVSCSQSCWKKDPAAYLKAVGDEARDGS